MVAMPRASAVIAAVIAKDGQTIEETRTSLARVSSRLRLWRMSRMLPGAAVCGRKATMPTESLLLAALLNSLADGGVPGSRLAEIAPRLISDPLWVRAVAGDPDISAIVSSDHAFLANDRSKMPNGGNFSRFEVSALFRQVLDHLNAEAV